MALLENAGAAFTGNNTTTAATSASFTPIAGSLIVLIAAVGNNTGAAGTSFTVSGTGFFSGATWTQLKQLLPNSGGGGAVWVLDAGSAPTAGTVTVTVNGGPTDIGIILRQFNGAKPAAQQNGVTATAGQGTIGTINITPGTKGSQVVGAFGTFNGAVTLTANGSTTVYGTGQNTTGGSTFNAFEANALSAGGTQLTLGFTTTNAGSGMVAAEILPAYGVQLDAVGPASGTCANSNNSGVPEPLTWTHVCGPSATAILISATTALGQTNAVTAVTYGGVACTFLKFTQSGTGSSNGGIAVYYLANPPTGSNTVSVTYTGANVTIGGSVSFSGSGGIGTAISTDPAATSSSISQTLSSTTTGGMIFNAACFGGGTSNTGVFSGTNSVAVREALTLDTNTASDNSVLGTVASTGGGASQTVGFSNTQTDNWGFISVEVLPPASAGPTRLEPSDPWLLRFKPGWKQHPSIPWFLPQAAGSVQVSDTDSSGPELDAGEQVTRFDFLQPQQQVPPAWVLRFKPGLKQDHPAIPLAPPTTFADFDTSHGTDAGELIALSDTDASTSTDAGERVVVLSSDTSGPETDAGESIAATLSDTDTSGPETESGQTAHLDYQQAQTAPPAWVLRFRPGGKQHPPIPLAPAAGYADSDSAHGTDAGESITATLSDSDSSSSTEASSITASLTSQDTSGSNDQGTTVGIGAADSSTSTDGSETIGLSSSDASSGADASTITASLSSSDASGPETEASSIAATLSDTDASGPENDNSEVITRFDFDLGMAMVSQAWLTVFGRQRFPQRINLYLPSVSQNQFITDSDHCLGEDAEIDQSPVDSDSVTGTDAGEQFPARLSSSDTVKGTDAGESLTGTWAISDTDSCKGTDAGYQSGGFSDSDTGHGTDLESTQFGPNQHITDTESCQGADLELIDVYAYVPLFRWNGGGFYTPWRPDRAPERPLRAAPAPERLSVTLTTAPALEVTFSITPVRRERRA